MLARADLSSLIGVYSADAAYNDVVTASALSGCSGRILGLGLGGFFDGIVLHQILQVHHMVSNWYHVDTLANLRLNTLWDGLFHAVAWVFVAIGLTLLWRHAKTQHLAWSNEHLIGSLLVGWGTFNVVEGIVDHEILGVHHVNERAPHAQWIFWDLGFLAWGAAMLFGGLAVLYQRHEIARRLD